MGSTSKGFSSLLVVILVASSLTIVESAFAQSISKPSVPEFTLKYVDHSYDVPPTTTTTIDPYTGKQTQTTQPGYRVENKTVDVIIKNQPFTSNKDTNGNYTSLFYNLRYKPHYTSEWRYYYEYDPYATFPTQRYVKAELSELNTVVSLPHGEDISFPQNGQVDVQVYAVITSESTLVLYGTTLYYYQNGTESDWSDIKTITLSDSSITVSNSPNPTPSSNPTTTPTSSATELTGNSITIPLSTLIAVVAVFLAIIVALSLMLFRRHRKAISPKQT